MPMESFCLLLVLLVLLVLLCCLCILTFAFPSKKIKKRSLHLPPGPKPWPFLGNLNLIGPAPHESLHLLSQKYGEIMQLYFGKFPVVVASSPEMAKQFLRVHDTVFASRPALAAGKYTSYNHSDVVWSPYGPYWRQARKIYLTGMFNAKSLESYKHIRVDEGRNFLGRVHALSGRPFTIRLELTRYTLSSICRMVLSNKYFSDAENGDGISSVITFDELQEMLDEWFVLGGVFNIGDWVPWLDFLDLQGYVKRMKTLHSKLDRFNEYVVDDHQAKRPTGSSVPKDVVDSLLQLADDPDLEVQLSQNCIKALVQNLLVGGTDTAATTVEWAIHELIKQPRIIEKAKEELNRVIGRNRWVDEDDFSQLPYLEAIIRETVRLHPLSTLLAPHYAMEDCNVAGYDIPKGTMVIINSWSLGRDPNSWDEPLEAFLPERFIGREVDLLGSNFALLPFGSGRRRCPGYKLGLILVRTSLANLIHGFNWKLPDGMNADEVCMEELFGLTTRPKESLSIVMEPCLDLRY